MIMNQKLLTLILSLVLLLGFAPPALAQEADGGQVIFGDNLVVEAGETLKRDVVVFGGNVTVQASGKIEGDLVVFGGSANIDGTVDGDIGMIGGNIDLGETAVVNGDIGLVGGHSNIADGATFGGHIENLNRWDYDYDHGFSSNNEDVGPDLPQIPRISPPNEFDGFSPFHWIGRAIGDIFWNAALVIILGLIAWLVAAFMPEQMFTVRQTVTETMPASFGFGLLTSVIIAASFLLVITICLAFVPFLAALVAGVAMLFGWIVIGQIIGERLLSTNGRPQPTFVFSTVIGVAILTLITNMPVIGEIPCIGFLLGLIGGLVGLLVSLTGLGAVMLTRFGTRPYPPQPPSYWSGRNPSPRPDVDYSGSEPASDVGIAPASEAELKARIKAALAEADQAREAPAGEPADPDAEPKPAGKKPRKKKPAGDEPVDSEADDDPDDTPKTNA
jgi:cytoskeletal protein CcmA (bactofilin family)